VDSDGGYWFDTGPAGANFIGRVSPEGIATRVVTGIPAVADPSDLKTASTRPPSAGRLAPDGVGGVFIASGAKIVRIGSDNALTTVAGDAASPSGATGKQSSGDGGPAGEARFQSTRSLAVDEARNLYVADQIDPRRATVRIRFINRSAAPVVFYPGTPQELAVAPGNIATIAGANGRSSSGDGGPALVAILQGTPPAMAAANGRLYVAIYSPKQGGEPGSSSVRMINLGGLPVTAHGVLVGAGQIATVAGGPAGAGAKGAPALSYVPGIASDGQGNLYLADEFHQRVDRLDPAGALTPIAGAGGVGKDDGGFNGNDKPAAQARLNRPFDVKVGPGGTLLVADQLNNQIRVVSAAGTIRAAPGSGVGMVSRCRGESETPIPGGPISVVSDRKGTIYFANALINQIKKITPTGLIETVAGSGNVAVAERTFDGDGGPARSAKIFGLSAIALDRQANLYLFDAGNARVRFVNLGSISVVVHGVRVSPGNIATVAGNGRADRSNGDGGKAGRSDGEGDGGKALKATLAPPESIDATALMSAYIGATQKGASVAGGSFGGLAVDSHQNLLIADTGNGRVRQVDSAGSITTLIGKGALGGAAQCCLRPVALALDSADNLYIADHGESQQMRLADFGGEPGTPDAHPRVWFVNRGKRPLLVRGRQAEPGVPLVAAGNRAVGLRGDGAAAPNAELLPTTGLAVDSRGNLFIAEASGISNDVRKVDQEGNISFLAGSAPFQFNGDGRKGALTGLNFPAGLAADPCGNLLIADMGNDRIRRLNLSPSCSAESEPK